MLHFVVKPFDGNYPFEQVCKELFGDNRCLVMLEKKGGDHCHVQGELLQPMDDCVWQKKISPYLNGLHYKRKLEPKSNPVKRRKTVADDTGFQYMSKELPSSIVIYKQGFTDEDLDGLYSKSQEYREELQSKLGEYIFEKCGGEVGGRSPVALHQCMCGHALRYYMDQDKMCPPNIKLLVRHYMLKYYGEDQNVFEYLSKLIM